MIIPEIQIPYIYNKIIKDGTHILIAGASGSGKSTVLNGLIYSILHTSPEDNKFILIDLKKVELYHYSKCPHTINYIDTINSIDTVINNLINIMRRRYAETRSAGLRKYPGGNIWIMIDEYADIALNCSKQTIEKIALIATQGRAAKIHLVICTQRPTRDIITPLIKVNCDYVLGLRTSSPQDSRNILQDNILYTLPVYGTGVYKIPGGPELYKFPIPLIPDEEINSIISLWTG